MLKNISGPTVSSAAKLFLLRLGLFQELRVEGTRKEVAHLQSFCVAAKVCEHHGDVAAELPDELAARAAGRRQTLRVGDDGDCAEASRAFRNCLPDSDALGAHRQLVGRALDVAARVDLS